MGMARMRINTEKSPVESNEAKVALTTGLLALALIGFSIFWFFNAPTILHMQGTHLSEDAQTITQMVDASRERVIEVAKWIGPAIIADLLALALTVFSFRHFVRFAEERTRRRSDSSATAQ